MQKNNPFFFFVTIAALSFSSGSAAAQAVPGAAEPSRVPRQIAPMETPRSPEGAAGVTSKGALQAPKDAEKIKFKLASVKIDGATAYPGTDFAPFYQDMVGKTVTLADIYDLANRLTVKYRNDGYILTQVVVPPQTIEGGHIRLRVVEGFTNDIRIEDKTNGKLNGLKPYVDKIKAARPFNSKILERYLLLINDLPGISAKAVLSPSRVPEATDILIVVERKPYDLFFQADNRGSRFMGPVQLNAGARLNNMLGTYEGINLQYALAPSNGELNYGSVGVTEPLGYEGTLLTLSGSATRTRPGFTLATFDVRGLAKSINLDVMHPFVRSRNKNLNGTIRFNYLDSHRTDNLGTNVTDRLSVLRLGTLFQNVDSFAGANALSAEISKGLGIFNSTSASDLNTTRPGADDKFLKGTAEISRLQRLTPKVDIFGSISGQLSAERLLTSEQFGLGGIAYGGAYDSSEITGDDGIAARGELRLNDPLATSLQTTQVYAFYDIGKIWDPGNTVASSRVASLASLGAGLRLGVNQNISGSFELAKPLTHDVGTAGNRNPRLFAALTSRF